MNDPMMRRAVWLTESQRLQLLEAATRACAAEGANAALCAALIVELEALATRLLDLHADIRTTVNGLQMPADCLPVYTCDAELEQVILFGDLSDDLAHLAHPPVPLPAYPPIVLDLTRRRRARRK